MLKTDRLKSLVVLIVAGLIGGALSRTVADIIPCASAQREKADQVLKAGRFELVDSQGRTRAALYIQKSGPIPYEETSLAFYDEKGNPVTSLTTENGVGPSSTLELREPRGNSSILFEAGYDGVKLEAKKGKKMMWSAP